MKREFLKGLNLEDAAIDAIMAEYGKDVNPLKDALSAMTGERDNLKAKLDAAAPWEEKYNTETAALRGQVAELQKTVAVRDARDKAAKETGVPVDLITGETEDACMAQAKALASWRGETPKYPSVPDSGETARVTGGTTRDQFSDWFTQKL